MQFRLKITMDNAAFGDDATIELARLLANVTRRISGAIPGADMRAGAGARIIDSNGNAVGEWKLEE